MLLVGDRERELIARIGPVLLRRFDDLIAEWTQAWAGLVGDEPPADLPGLTRTAVVDGVEPALDAQQAEGDRLVAAGVPVDHVAAAVLLWEEAVLRRLARDAVEDIFAGAAALNRFQHRLVLLCAERYGGILTMSHDRVARELADADRLKTELVSMISHDLKTPLTTIQACVNEMLEAASAVDDEQRSRFLVLIGRNADRLSQLITRILDVSKIEAHALDLSPEPVEVRRTIRRLVDAALPTAAVEVRAAADVVCLADREAFERIALNLIDNAVRFSPEGRAVVVDVVEDGEAVEIQVADGGPGVPDDRRDGLFTKFFQVDLSHSGRRTGSGLGLAIVRGLAEAMGGSAGHRPNEPSGSVFWVRLPQARTPERTA